MFEREGIQLNAKTINGWIAKVCVLLKVLYEAFCEYQFSQPYLQADETTLKVLKIKKKGKKKQSPYGLLSFHLIEHLGGSFLSDTT